MSNIKLKDRIGSYQDSSDYKLLNRVPLIISINGRAFAKSTELLDKPYCPKFSECMLSTTLRLCAEVDGALFAYQHNDEIVLVVRNDQSPDTNPWYDNRLQKICSVTSSIATLHFSNCANAIDLNLIGDPIFTSQVFVVPNIMEAINTMVYKQQANFHTSIQFACFYELLKKYDKHNIKEMLAGLSVDEKIDLLNQECGVNFNDYPNQFKRGSACYRAPKVIDGVMKNKWSVNLDLPIFTKDQSFLSNIFKNGADIFRSGSF
jgi:tRNA(His) 5'-end guanylyltransferase